MIQREIYLKKIKKYINIDTIKVITGIRRSGKTYFILQIIDFLKKEKRIKQKNIIYIDKEDLKFKFIVDYEDLDKFIKEKSKNISGKKYLFIDEIQDITYWEKTIRSYYKKDFDIYITGSNSNLLSGELATFLTGRFVNFAIYPLNFKEFLEFRRKTRKFGVQFPAKLPVVFSENIGTLKEEFENFMKFGGLPVIHKLNLEEELIYSHIGGIFDSIIFRDIVSRYNIRNSGVLLDIFKFLCDNTGNIVSSKKIVSYLKKENINISLDTLREYLFYFCNAFLLYKSSRYDVKGKKYLDLLEKYYLGDLGFRNYLFGFNRKDIGHLIENIVYLELKTRGYDVNIGKLDNNLEIDFIVQKNGKTEYYQVCYLLQSEEIIKREFGVYEKVKDNYPKYVLSMDDFFGDNYNGVHRLNLIEWLLGKT